MYSLVLMMALSGSADAPAGLFGGHGCNGGCSGYACSGGSCSGSSCHGGGHKLFGGHGCRGSSCHGGHGCSGGCTGYVAACGCCGGGGHGCNGGHKFFGGHGCRGGCHGGGGCCGGGYACTGGAGCCGGGAGCTGGAGCMGGAAGVPVAPPPKPADKMPEDKKPEAKPEAAKAAPAVIYVSLPADAKLTIDGNETRSISASRSFVTPALPMGKEFNYTLKAEVVRDGQAYSVIRRVTVQAGVDSRITLEVPVSSVAAK
jgi:uncharacterized protein (TIGR03000 family)